MERRTIDGYQPEQLRHDLLVLYMMELRDRGDLTGLQRMVLYRDLMAIMEEERKLLQWIDRAQEEARWR